MEKIRGDKVATTKIKINNVDITEDVEVLDAKVVDKAIGIDLLDVTLSNRNNNWKRWNIEEEDTIELEKDGFKTGVMYVNIIRIYNGRCILKASSLKREHRILNTYTLENTTLSKIAETTATAVNMQLETYNLNDFEYERIDCVDESYISYLTKRGMLEGYNVKVANNKIIMYNVKEFEGKRAVESFGIADFIGEFEVSRNNLETYSKCKMYCYPSAINAASGTVEYTDARIRGGSLITPKVKISNLAEGQRFSKNILEYKNRNYINIYFKVEFKNNLAGSSVVEIKDIGRYSGRYFIEQIQQDMFNNVSYILARKIGD